MAFLYQEMVCLDLVRAYRDLMKVDMGQKMAGLDQGKAAVASGRASGRKWKVSKEVKVEPRHEKPGHC
jgi:CxxC motif-containing protein (DUF1111 family)